MRRWPHGVTNAGSEPAADFKGWLDAVHAA